LWPAVGSGSNRGSAAWRFTQCSIRSSISGIPVFWQPETPIAFLDITASQLGCFLLFWLINIAVVWRGIESIRVLLNIKAPLLIFLGLLLLGWAYVQADGFGPMLTQPSQFDAGQPKAGQFWKYFFPALTANVSFWATLSLNIPDFSRYARSQRDQIVGQTFGLPTTMALYSFIGVAVTSATIVIYREAIWDPVVLLTKFKNPAVLILSMFALCLATLATNIAANVVGPANDIANLAPKWISFRLGGLITGLVGILIQPWRLLASAGIYIFKWLVGYSLLLGACGGVLIADYWFIRRGQLDLAGLYKRKGPYWYWGGWNPAALVALVAGMAPCLPGFVSASGLCKVSPVCKGFYDAVSFGSDDMNQVWMRLYDYAWFVSFGVSFVVYVVLTMILGNKSPFSAKSDSPFDGFPSTHTQGDNRITTAPSRPN